jgi:hypothetical protein
MHPVDERTFQPGTPEVQIEEVPTMPVWIGDRRAQVGSLVLTNDRMLWIKETGAGAAESVITELLATPGQVLARAREEAQVLMPLGELARARIVPRRVVANLYEFTLADGSIFRIGARLAQRWEPTIQRLLTERHQRSVVRDDSEGWSVT